MNVRAAAGNIHCHVVAGDVLACPLTAGPGLGFGYRLGEVLPGDAVGEAHAGCAVIVINVSQSPPLRGKLWPKAQTAVQGKGIPSRVPFIRPTSLD